MFNHRLFPIAYINTQNYLIYSVIHTKLLNTTLKNFVNLIDTSEYILLEMLIHVAVINSLFSW